MKISDKEYNKKLGSEFARISGRIDYSKFEEEKKAVNHKKIIIRSVLGVCCCAALCVVLVPVLAFMDVKETVKLKKVSYSLNEINQLESSSFHALNQVNYPSLTNEKESYYVDGIYQKAVQTFALKMNKQVEIENENVVYSPLSLYSFLDILSTFSDDEEVLHSFDSLLGASMQVRNDNYDNMYRNNFYVTSEATTQMYQGLFVDNNYQLRDDLLEDLTKRYVEAYGIDFTKEQDISKLLKWVDGKIDEKGYLNTKDLEIKDDTMLILFSTLYYKNRWSNKYLEKDSFKDTFYGKEKENTITYMHHTYMGDAYDYGTYISFRDYYKNNYTIKYFVPKDNQSSIFDLLDEQTIFQDDETKHILPSENEYTTKIYIDLSLPKFKVEDQINFTESLKNLGLAKMFDMESRCFNSAFQNLDSNSSIYMQYVKQKNSIVFDEDGTIAKTVTYGGVGDKAEYFGRDTLLIKLNQPFLYVIEDENHLPLYVGSVNNL